MVVLQINIRAVYTQKSMKHMWKIIIPHLCFMLFWLFW